MKKEALKACALVFVFVFIL